MQTKTANGVSVTSSRVKEKKGEFYFSSRHNISGIVYLLMTALHEVPILRKDGLAIRCILNTLDRIMTICEPNKYKLPASNLWQDNSVYFYEGSPPLMPLFTMAIRAYNFFRDRFTRNALDLGEEIWNNHLLK